MLDQIAVSDWWICRVGRRTREPGVAHRAEGLICCSSLGSQKTKRSKTAVTFSIISILRTITHCVPASSAKADIARLWPKTPWCWAGSDRHTPGKFPFWQVANATFTKDLCLLYLRACHLPKSPHLPEKLGCQNWDQEAKAFQQETSSGASVTGNKVFGEVST